MLNLLYLKKSECYARYNLTAKRQNLVDDKKAFA